MSNLQKKIAISIFSVIGIIYLAEKQSSNKKNLEQLRKNRERATEESAKIYRNKEIKDYLSCDLGPSACSKLFPVGSKAVNEAKKYGQENRED